MKISEAIRIGIKLDGKQIVGSLYEFDKDGNAISCCAIGAAKIGALNSLRQEILEAIDSQELFPDIHNFYDGKNILFSEMARRNDAGETREAIADWLESIGH